MATLLRRSSPTTPNHHHHYLRSTSLPTPSHPLLSNLSLALQSLHNWSSTHYLPSTTATNTSTLTTGLSHVHRLLSSLTHLLRLPNTRHLLLLLHRPLLLSLLDSTLFLADAYGSLRDHLVSLHQLLSQSQVAVRRKDPQSLSSATRARRRVEKEVLRLASTMGSSSSSSNNNHEPAAAATTTTSSEEEVMGLLREANAAIFTASSALFSGLVAISSERSCGSSAVSSSAWEVLRQVVRKGKAKGKEEEEVSMEGLRRVEECVVEVEGGSEKVFRELLRTRVMLLNILTP